MEDGEIFILEDIQKPSGHDPGQAARDNSAWAERLDQMNSRGHFQLQPSWDSGWFYRG